MAVTELMKIYKKAKKGRAPAQAAPQLLPNYYDYVKTPRPKLEIVPDAPPLEPPPGQPPRVPPVFPSGRLTGLASMLYSPDLNPGEDEEVRKMHEQMAAGRTPQSTKFPNPSRGVPSENPDYDRYVELQYGKKKKLTPEDIKFMRDWEATAGKPYGEQRSKETFRNFQGTGILDI